MKNIFKLSRRKDSTVSVPMIGIMLWWGWLQVAEQVKGTPLIGIISGKDRERAAP